MSSLTRLARHAVVRGRFAPVITQVRTGFDKRIWMPKSQPTTEEECREAAARYGMIPDDYKPAPKSDHTGDYPDIPKFTGSERDPNEPWDYRMLRLNYGEPIPQNYHVMLPDTVTHDRYYYPIAPWKMIVALFGMYFGTWLFLSLGNKYSLTLPMKPEPMPYEEGADTSKHLTFELVDEHDG